MCKLAGIDAFDCKHKRQQTLTHLSQMQLYMLCTELYSLVLYR